MFRIQVLRSAHGTCCCLPYLLRELVLAVHSGGPLSSGNRSFAHRLGGLARLVVAGRRRIRSSACCCKANKRPCQEGRGHPADSGSSRDYG